LRQARLLHSGTLRRQYGHNRLSTNASRIFSLVAVRNAGLDAARAELESADRLLVLDADVYYEPGALQAMLAAYPPGACAAVPYAEQAERTG